METDSLTVELTPLCLSADRMIGSSGEVQLTRWPDHPITRLFHLFMRRMLPAPAAKLLQLNPVRRRLTVLRGRIVPLFAFTALHRNDLSGHINQLLAVSF